MGLNLTIMRTIFKSIVLITLVALFCACLFVIIGLILNFWNETTINASIAFIVAVMIGTITYFGIQSALDCWTGDKLPF